MSAGSLAARAAAAVDYGVIMPLLARVSWRLALWWGRRRGDLLYWLRREGRRAAVDNVLQVCGDGVDRRAARRIARRAFQAQTCEESEAFFYPVLGPARFGTLVRVVGADRLDRALARGKGAVVFSIHYDSPCLPIFALAYHGTRVHAFLRSVDDADNPLSPAARRYARRKVARIERVMGRPFLVTGTDGVAVRARNALAAGGVVYIMLDVPPELAKRRTAVRFLGRPAALPSGAEALAEATGAALVPVIIRRNPNGVTHALEFFDEVSSPAERGGTLQRCCDVMDAEIRADPGQFFMWEFARSFWLDDSHASSLDGESPAHIGSAPTNLEIAHVRPESLGG